MRVYRPCVAAILLTFATAASATQSSDGDRLHGVGQAQAASGDYRTTLIRLKSRVKASPDDAEARFDLGVFEYRGGDFVAAEMDLVLAREKGFPVAKVSPLLADAYLAAGKFQQLLNDVAPCPTDPQCNADVSALRAQAYLGLRDLDNADKESLAAIQADPNGETSRTTHALVMLAHNDTAGAETIIDGVLAGSPRSGAALIVKGDLRRRANDFESAARAYRAALEVNPRDTATRQSLAMVLLAAGHDEDARVEVNQVLAQSPNATMALYLKAVILVRAKKTAEALDTVRPIEAAITQIPQGLFLLALIHASSNNLEQALNYAGQFHAAEPDNLVGTKLLANIDFRLGAYAKVISLLAPLRDRLGDDGEALDQLGSAYLANGQVKEANELLNEAVKAQPNNPLALARLAESQTRQSATRDEGIRELERIVQNDPKNAQIDLALVSAFIGGGDYDRAIAAATTMARSQPASPLPLTLRGAARLGKGDDDAGARGDFTAALDVNPDYVPAAVYLTELDMRVGKFDEARRLLDGVLKRQPADMRALLARAQVEERANMLLAAVPYLEAAFSAHPTEVEPRIRLMQVKTALGDKEKVALVAADLARSQSGNPAVVEFAARTLLSIGKAETALALYRQLEVAFPQSPAIFEHAGVALAGQGQLDEARTAFDRAIAIDQRDMAGWIDRAALELKVNGLDAAMLVAAQAKAKNPDNPAAAVLPGDLLLSVGKAAEAEESYRKAMTKTPATLTVIRLHQSMVGNGDPTGADALLAGWIIKNPDDFDARAALAGHQMAEGDYRGAATQYETLLAKLPNSAVVLNNLAWTYGNLNDPRATATAKRAYFLSSATPAIMDTYGFLLFRGGDQQQGSGLIRRAFAAIPKNPQVAYHMAMVLAASGDSSGANSILKDLVNSKTVFDEADQAKALYVKLGGS